MEIDEWAAATAAGFLDGLPRRWSHTCGVARAADDIAYIFEPADRPVLRAAAYLHDIGYSADLVASGFHPLDGAAWLQRAGYPRLAGLIAHHSGARHEARLRGLAADLASYLEERSELSDALAYCDLTTGPDGQPMTYLERLTEIADRYGAGHLVSRAVHAAGPELGEAVARIHALLVDNPAVESAPPNQWPREQLVLQDPHGPNA
jgi:hypothetical protein